jgi:hypothetical protein
MEKRRTVTKSYNTFPSILAKLPDTCNERVRFEITEGPQLEEWIPEPYLPEVLIVYDPDNVLSIDTRIRSPMKIYKRVVPTPASTQSKDGDTIKDE